MGLVEIKADNIVLVGQSGNKHFIGVGFNGNVNRMLQILFKLLQQIILKTYYRALIYEIVSSMVKQAYR